MEPVKDHQGMKIIGIDNGYGNIKTANCCFPAGLTAHDAEPVFKDDLLTYDGRYYLIGAGHKAVSYTHLDVYKRQLRA